MTESSADAVLSVAEKQSAEALLSQAWGEQAVVRAAQLIWNRRHVVRLQCAGGRSAVLKRPEDRGRRPGRDGGFRVELATLDYLTAMPVPVAPRLLGADLQAGILVMEELPPGGSLADSLLAGDRARAQADLVAYARALGSLHAWSMGRAEELTASQARYGPPGRMTAPGWFGAAGRGQEAFLALAGTLGVTASGVAEEIAGIGPLLAGPGYLGLVHGDACPDNVRIIDGSCRIFDFETSSWGPVVLDAAYLQAPFPSCWCFARLPAEAVAPAADAYRACLAAAGVSLGPAWEAATTAALAGWIVARGPMMARALEEDRSWGTTTMRPRLLAWLGTFTRQAARTGVLPRLQALAGALHEQLAARWPGVRVPEYPALAQPGAVLAQPPGRRRSGRSRD